MAQENKERQQKSRDKNLAEGKKRLPTYVTPTEKEAIKKLLEQMRNPEVFDIEAYDFSDTDLMHHIDVEGQLHLSVNNDATTVMFDEFDVVAMGKLFGLIMIKG